MVKPVHLLESIFRQLFSRTLIAGVVSAIGLFSGLTPTLNNNAFDRTSKLVFSNTAYAQVSISNEERQNYARSVLAIEPIRQAAYNEIKRIIGSGQVPPIACHRPSSLNTLNQNIRQIAVNYCNRAIRIVESNNLTINRFNTITVTMQGDPSLASTIQQELIRLQQRLP